MCKHKPLLETRAVSQALSDKYSSQLLALKEEFIRFADLNAIEYQFNLLSSLFVCAIETANDELQLVELYASLYSEKSCMKEVCVVCINLHL